jgi:hypothetical protein
MKARLEFDLPEEQEEFEICHRARDLYCNLWDLAQQIRTWRKHGHRFKRCRGTLGCALGRLHRP